MSDSLKFAVVTGAARGIGRSLALRLAKKGYAMAIADIDREGLRAVETEVSALGSEVMAVETDVSSARDIQRLCDEVHAGFGRVDLLINNAGILTSGNSWEIDQETWRKVIDVNLWSVIHAAREFVPRMLQRGGRIVNVASMGGLASGPWVAPYCVSKYGVVAFSESLAAEFAAQHIPITVSVVCPGAVSTGIADALEHHHANETPLDLMNSSLQRMICTGTTPDDLAEDVLAQVDEGRFWILTHPEVREAVKARAAEIVRRERGLIV